MILRLCRYEKPAEETRPWKRQRRGCTHEGFERRGRRNQRHQAAGRRRSYRGLGRSSGRRAASEPGTTRPVGARYLKT